LPADFRQLEVEHHERELGCVLAGQQLERFGAVAGEHQPVGEVVAPEPDRRQLGIVGIVLDEQDVMGLLGAHVASPVGSRVKVNVAPRPTSPCALICPPWRAMIR
jgi:hypothetical protein